MSPCLIEGDELNMITPLRAIPRSVSMIPQCFDAYLPVSDALDDSGSWKQERVRAQTGKLDGKRGAVALPSENGFSGAAFTVRA